jgi:hypothetical protein
VDEVVDVDFDVDAADEQDLQVCAVLGLDMSHSATTVSVIV